MVMNSGMQDPNWFKPCDNYVLVVMNIEWYERPKWFRSPENFAPLLKCPIRLLQVVKLAVVTGEDNLEVWAEGNPDNAAHCD